MSPNFSLSPKLTSKQNQNSSLPFHSCFTTRNSLSLSSATAPPYTIVLNKGTSMSSNSCLSLKLTSKQEVAGVSALNSCYTKRNFNLLDSFTSLQTPLHVCASEGLFYKRHLDVVKFLFESKADLNTRSSRCHCPSFVFYNA